MIASPGDVQVEREIIREVIAEWNAQHAQERKGVLLPVGWETHSTPELGNRPQAIINANVLRNCDLLVAVFWTRLGTSTGVAPSGTVEEIQEHVAAGKPAMVYFSSVEVKPDQVDSDQYAAVTAFKKKCQSLGLFAEFGNREKFRSLFSRHLGDHANRLLPMDQQTQDELSTALRRADRSQERSPRRTLSDDAVRALQLAAREGKRQGRAEYMPYLGGTRISAGEEVFTDAHPNPKDVARWTSAFKELTTAGLFEANHSTHGLIFYEVTHAGYQLTEQLETQE